MAVYSSTPLCDISIIVNCNLRSVECDCPLLKVRIVKFHSCGKHRLAFVSPLHALRWKLKTKESSCSSWKAGRFDNLAHSPRYVYSLNAPNQVHEILLHNPFAMHCNISANEGDTLRSPRDHVAL